MSTEQNELEIALEEKFEDLLNNLDRVNPEQVLIFNYLRRRTISLLRFRGRLDTTPDSWAHRKVLKQKLKVLKIVLKFLEQRQDNANIVMTARNMKTTCITALWSLSYKQFGQLDHQLGLLSLYPYDLLTNQES